MFMGTLLNSSKGVRCSQGIYKFHKVICQERRTSSIKVQLTPIQTWLINIAIVNKRQTIGCSHRLFRIFRIFLLMYLISSLKSWSYLLIKLHMTTWGFLCVSYPSISFTNLFNFFSVFILFEISFGSTM